MTFIHFFSEAGECKYDFLYGDDFESAFASYIEDFVNEKGTNLDAMSIHNFDNHMLMENDEIMEKMINIKDRWRKEKEAAKADKRKKEEYAEFVRLTTIYGAK